MVEHPLLEMHLRGLKRLAMLGNYQRLAGEVAEPIEYLTQLAALEVSKRHENGVRARIAGASARVRRHGIRAPASTVDQSSSY
jgi:hypothetical protein